MERECYITLIQLNEVTKVFVDGFVALSDVTLKIDKGEFAFVVGPSGAGKSTLIKLLFREQLVTSGEIVVNGRNLSQLQEHEVPYFRRSLGIVFQDFRLLPDKNCYETNGGRVLAVVAQGDTLSEARQRAHNEIKKIQFHGMQRRPDIGFASFV